jgi:RNA polymerase sigma-70 factor, ECF subfamily
MDEDALVEALRRGDEDAFARLVANHGALLRRVALRYVGDAALAEDVVQETWLAVLVGIERFEQRSSLKTWMLSIVANRARTRHAREPRNVPLSAVGDDAPSQQPGPEATLLAREAFAVAGAAVRALPARQHDVIARAVGGRRRPGTNERVLLHRARTSVRAALEAYQMI